MGHSRDIRNQLAGGRRETPFLHVHSSLTDCSPGLTALTVPGLLQPEATSGFLIQACLCQKGFSPGRVSSPSNIS